MRKMKPFLEDMQYQDLPDCNSKRVGQIKNLASRNLIAVFNFSHTVHTIKSLNMKKLFIASTLIFLCFRLSVQAQYLKNESETSELSKKCSVLFQENKIAECFVALSAHWPMPENEIQSLEEKTIKYLNILEQRFGKPIGNLKVKNETIADVGIRETYLVRYENTAIRLIFTYYKNDNGWIVNTFKWDDSFTDEFK